jgi:hypothetical protein
MKSILVGTTLACVLAVTGCASTEPSIASGEATGDVSQGLGGCSMDQIHEAQNSCRNVCANLGGSNGVHYCDAVSGGGYVAPCDCARGPDDKFVEPPPPPPPPAPPGSGEQLETCLLKPDPDTTCFVAFWERGATALDGDGKPALAALLRWGISSGSPATFRLYTTGGITVRNKVVEDANFKAFMQTYFAPYMTSTSTSEVGFSAPITYANADLSTAFPEGGTLDIRAGKHPDDAAKTTPPIRFNITAKLTGNFKGSTVGSATTLQPELDTLSNDQTKTNALAVVKDFAVEIEWSQVYTFTEAR